MLKRILKLITRLFLVAVVIGAAFVVAMRKKYAPVQDAVRRMNRDVVNPQQMATAGTPGAYASIIKHIGRTSGTPYDTPVQARPTEDGFVIPLPYGRSPDWLKNVSAAGSATLVTEGETYQVEQPEFIPADAAAPYVEEQDRKTQQLFGVDEFLKLRTVTVAAAPAEGAIESV